MSAIRAFKKWPPATKTATAIAVASVLIVAVAIVTCTRPALAQSLPFGAAKAAPLTGFTGWALAKQAIFYRALSRTIVSAKTDGTALWTLMGIAFIYGVFHAAGPGHGKAVISSYLVANNETWRRGVVLSFASALVQSLTAVLIVGFAAVLLGATGKIMGDAVRAIEITSYSLITLLGVRLVWLKGLGFIRAAVALSGRDGKTTNEGRPHQTLCDDAHRQQHAGAFDIVNKHAGGFGHLDCCHHHDDGHGHAHGRDHEPDLLPWGHAHGPEPQELSGPGGWRRGLSAVMAAGLRPCSGAILLLVFALSQGLFWAGVVSTFVMGLGTAITVTAIATFAVAAKTLVRRFASDDVSYASVLVRGLEVGAAALVLAFGILSLGGYMASERLVGF